MIVSDSEDENENVACIEDIDSCWSEPGNITSSDSSYSFSSDSSTCDHTTGIWRKRKKKAKIPPYNWHNTTSTGHTDYKPFNTFMNDVVFSLSGFINPFRANLKTKAMEMGAHYRADWDNTCTHLICAFRDTPKYNQVKGKGKIIKKDWIEDCYSARVRFPWRRYALDWRDGEGNESEDEIQEDLQKPLRFPGGAKRPCLSPHVGAHAGRDVR